MSFVDKMMLHNNTITLNISIKTQNQASFMLYPAVNVISLFLNVFVSGRPALTCSNNNDNNNNSNNTKCI